MITAHFFLNMYDDDGTRGTVDDDGGLGLDDRSFLSITVLENSINRLIQLWTCMNRVDIHPTSRLNTMSELSASMERKQDPQKTKYDTTVEISVAKEK